VKYDSPPEGWVRTTIGSVALINPKIDRDAYPDCYPVSFLGMKAVSAESGAFDASEIRAFGRVKKRYTAFADGDVLFAKITPCMENGKIAFVYGLKNGIGFGSTEFHVIRPTGAGPVGKFMLYFLLQESFRNDARLHMSGSAGQARVPTRYMVEAPFFLGPLGEQKRIVRKIDELFSALEAGMAALQKAKALLKRYRQAVLKVAFEGRLSAQWREVHKHELEPASVLLERIREERRKKAGEEGKEYEEPPPADSRDLPELPEVWTVAYAVEVTVPEAPIIYGILRPGPNTEAGIPYVRPTEIVDDRIEVASLRRTTPEIAGRHFRSRLEYGDVLMSVLGTIGKVAIVPPELHGGNITRSLVRFRPDVSLLSSEYLAWCLRSPVVQDQFAGTKLGTGVRRITVEKVRRLRVPLAPVAEQAEVVERVGRLSSIAAKAEEAIDQSLAKARRLRQSILKRAFEGRLVPPDPNDEPADKLLERIKAEKARMEASSPRRRRKAPRKKRTNDKRRY